MKFNVSSKTFYNFVSAVSKVINSKNALTILNNFLFELRDHKLIITASDMENILVATMDVAQSEGEGRFCIDAKRLVDLLKEMPDQGVEFEVNDDNLSVDIRYPNGHYSFIALNGAEYPADVEPQDPDQTLSMTCPTEQIISGLDNTLFAVGTDTLRPQMMGVLWDIKPEGIVFVSTDTRKLVRYANRLSAPGTSGSFILPVKPANILKNVFVKEEAITVSVDPKSVIFATPTFRFTCRLIKGNFPDYDRVIPKSNAYTLTVDRLSFLNALRRVSVFVDQGHGLVKFHITPDCITLKAQDNNYCTSAIEKVECTFTGTEMVIGFSAPFLIEVVGTISTPELVINLNDPSRPGVFLPDSNQEESELLMLLMPMTVNEF